MMSDWFGRARFMLMAAIALAMATASAGYAQGSWSGTWEVNLTRSTYPGGAPSFKRMTCTIETWEANQMRVTYAITGTRGGVTRIEWIGAFDGRDYPVAGIDGYVVTHAYRRIDERTYDVVQKTEGRTTLTARMSISADGKTLTTLTPAPDSGDGTPVTVTVYDRR